MPVRLRKFCVNFWHHSQLASGPSGTVERSNAAAEAAVKTVFQVSNEDDDTDYFYTTGVE